VNAARLGVDAEVFSSANFKGLPANLPSYVNDPNAYINYTKYAKGLWKRADGSSAVNALVSNIMPMVAGSSLGQVGSDRLCIILPNDISGITIFPPVEGDLSVFKRNVSLLFSDNKVINPALPAMTLIFSSPFFGTVDNVKGNTELFEYFVFIKNIVNKSKHSIYILTQYSVNTILNSQNITKKINPSPDDSTPIYPLLEPTYIVLPYSMSIRATKGGNPIPGIAEDNRGGILISAASPNEPILPAADPSMQGLVGFILKDTYISALNGAVAAGIVGIPPQLGLAYKPNMQKEDPKLASMLFREINVKDDIDNSSYYTFGILANAAYKKTESNIKASSDIFAGSSNAVRDSIPVIPIQIGTQEYSIRSSLPEVRDDWNNLIFTDEEANFLTSLNITPARLSSIFPNDWKEELTANLSVISRSKCFKDDRLLLHADCQRTQAFIAKIFENFVENSSEIMEFEDGKLQALTTTLTNNILSQTTALRAAGVIASPDIFDPNNFTDAFFNKNPATTPHVLSVFDFTAAATAGTDTFTVSYTGAMTPSDKALLGFISDTPIGAGKHKMIFSAAKDIKFLNGLANTNTGHFRFIKNPDENAKPNLRPVPNYSMALSQFNINILLIDLNTKNKSKAMLTMDVPTGVTENEMTQQYKNIIAQYNLIKNGIVSKFPAIRIILPE